MTIRLFYKGVVAVYILLTTARWGDEDLLLYIRMYTGVSHVD